MYEFKYETFRTLHHVDKEDRRNLVEVMDNPGKIKKFLMPIVGERVIALYHPRFSDGEIISGGMEGGFLGEVEVYREQGRPLNATLFFKSGGFGTGLNGVYDIMLVNSLVENKENPDFKDLRVFHFSQSAANDSEKAEVIHVDPYLAYLALRSQNRIHSPTQDLRVEKMRLGHSNYQYKWDPD